MGESVPLSGRRLRAWIRNPSLIGFGTHFCLGSSLARLEARIAFEELLNRIPDYRLLEPKVERLCSGPIRGAVRLPVAFG